MDIRRLSAALVLLISAILGGTASCGRVDTGNRRPNVILITMDTMRADHISCYGYSRHTSPRIDQFADVATMYTRAMASAPWTIPSHASMFTGMDPFEHGAHTLVPNGKNHNIRPLDEDHVSVTEVLRDEGYTTGAFVANDGFLSTRWQLDQGFEFYHVKREPAKALNVNVFAWLDSVRNNDKPFFLFINYMDTHRPYNATPRPGFLKEPPVQDEGQLLVTLYVILAAGEGPAPESLVEKIIDQYDTAVANLDEQIGKLIDHLVKRNLYDDTLIILTADHGEYFGEHTLVEHSKDVYQEALWVPLIVKAPGQLDASHEDAVVSSSDIPMMILSALSPDMPDRYAGVFRNSIGNHPPISENYYSRTRDLLYPDWGDRFNRVRTVVYDWPYKYIYSSDGNSELYDLDRDVGELSNLADTRSQVMADMQSRLEELIAKRGRYAKSGKRPTLTEEEVEKLRSLGYVGD